MRIKITNFQNDSKESKAFLILLRGSKTVFDFFRSIDIDFNSSKLIRKIIFLSFLKNYNTKRIGMHELKSIFLLLNFRFQESESKIANFQFPDIFIFNKEGIIITQTVHIFYAYKNLFRLHFVQHLFFLYKSINHHK